MTDRMNNDTPGLFPDSSEIVDELVSASQISSFLACRRRWYYGYVERLSQKHERDYLTIGRLCHAGMYSAMWSRWICHVDGLAASIDRLTEVGEDSIRSMWDEYMSITDFLPEEVPDQTEMLDRAIDVFREALEEFDPLRWVPITITRNGEDQPALEVHFLIEDGDMVGLHGYVDAIMTDLDSGQTWCIDYKFRRTLASREDEQFNLQNTIYAMACRYMDIDIAGTLTWQHHNTPSAVPRFNKDGSVSRSKIRCSWPRFRRFIIDAGLDPSDYSEMEDKLSDVETCRGTYEIRSDEMIDRVWWSIVDEASMQMGALRRLGREACMERCLPSMDPWTCRMCSFQSLCQANLRGYDCEYIRESEYRERQ